MSWLKENWFRLGGLICVLVIATLPSSTQAYGECDQYGFMASYDYLSGGCKCMSGYVMGKDFMGQTQCVSGSTVCHDKYGYHSSYDSLSSSCECDSGYAFGSSYGTKQCVSLDSLCSDQLGYNSRYNSLYDKCECSYGYVIDGSRCTDGDQVCHSRHGYNSSYKDSANKCGCDSGYTLDDTNQCVEKQNNVYFKLLDVDTDSREAIVKSTYDNRRYLITYGTGCYSSAVNRYKDRQIVINLGTDFDLDTWDKIVLQDDNQTCNITHRERTYDDTLEADSADDSIYYVPTYTTPTKASVPTPPKNVDLGPQLSNDERCVKLSLGTFYNTKKQNCDTCPSGTERVAGANTCQTPIPVVKRAVDPPVKAVSPRPSPDIKAMDTQKGRVKEVATSSQATTTARQVDSAIKHPTFWQKVVSPFKSFWVRIFK